jgi:hypothetical protein
MSLEAAAAVGSSHQRRSSAACAIRLFHQRAPLRPRSRRMRLSLRADRTDLVDPLCTQDAVSGKGTRNHVEDIP